MPSGIGSAGAAAERVLRAAERELVGVEVSGVELPDLGSGDARNPRDGRPVREGRVGVDVEGNLDLDGALRA